MTNPPNAANAPSAPSKLDLVLQEYSYLENAIDKFDGHRLKIRNWCIAVVGAVLALAFQSESSEIACLALAATFLCSLNEGLYISMQTSVIQRASELEDIVTHAGFSSDPDTAFINYKFGVRYAFEGTSTLIHAGQMIFEKGRLHTLFFYLTMMLGSAIAALLIRLH